MPDSTPKDAIPRFRLSPRNGKVQQRFPDDPYPDEFDPQRWATYMHGQDTVQAVRIPRPFMVGADICKDGWLVLEGKRLKAVGNKTFTSDYELTLLQGDTDTRNGLKVVE
jgi:hypothetical protein